MSRAERDKGARGEREVAAIFRAAGFDCDRTPNSGALRIAGDLYGELPAHVEVKRQETLRLPLWLRQARDEAEDGALPVVAFRQSHGEWFAALPLEDLVALFAARAERVAEIERLWRHHLDESDACDDDGGHIGVAMYHRNVARGLGEALRIIERTSVALPADSAHDAARGA